MRVLHYSIALALAVASITTLATNAKRPWTFFVYMAADNNLNPEADLNISQMVKASSTINAYIVVYLTIKRNGENKKTQKLIIQNGIISQQGATTVEDSGSVQTFLNALIWAITEFPSDHLLVDLWDHGSGPLNRFIRGHKGVCYDDTTGNYLTDLDYKHAFDVAVNQYRNGQKIDIITFDACLMADLEVAFTLKQYTNYLVASQETVPGPGFNYSTVLSIFGSKTPDPLTFAKWLVTCYDKNYKFSSESYTLAAIDLSKLDLLVNATNSIAQLLTRYMNVSVSKAITQSTQSLVCQHFDEPTYIDVSNFYTNIINKANKMGLNSSQQTALKNACNTALKSYPQLVISNVTSTGLKKAKGLSIYFADVNEGLEPSYNDLYWTSVNPAWRDFLNQYLNYA
jgi:hypothetical protein